MAHLRNRRAEGSIDRASGAAAAALKARAAAWSLPVTEGPEGLAVTLWGAELRLIALDPGMRIEILAPEDRLVGIVREAATEIMAEVGLTVAWTALEVGALAPGLSLMQVARVWRSGANFTHLHLTGPDAARLGQGGLHVRLLLPRAGRQAVWPRVGPSGRTAWPEGADALHRPVYTVADQRGDGIEIAIFRHADSPTCDWADRVAPGATVGVMGPGGGWCPEGRLHLFGDQTALPAIARLMRLARGRATAVLRCDPADLGPLAEDPAVTVTEDLCAALRAWRPDAEGHVWFAAEAEEARTARRILADHGLARGQSTVAAYWTAGRRAD